MSSKKKQSIQGEGPSKNGPPGIDEVIDPNKIITVNANDGKTGDAKDIKYQLVKIIGSGSFGVVFQAKILETNQMVAIKKVVQDKRFKNRELPLMRLLSHPNVVDLRYYFYTNDEASKQMYLNLMLEFVPDTIHRVYRNFNKAKKNTPFLEIKLYMYQLFRSLAYIHSLQICHRDIKPQNLLVDEASGVLKLCDFGSAKILDPSEANVSYICSRFYRAPELIFGSTKYTTAVDVWSAGCVMGELVLQRPLFTGDDALKLLVHIIQVMGTPTKEERMAMNPDYAEFNMPSIKPREWTMVFTQNRLPPEGFEFISKIMQYVPTRRLTPMEALADKFFDELRRPETKLSNNRPLPPLFNFTEQELELRKDLNRKLIPPHAEAEFATRNIDLSKYIQSPSTSASTSL